MIREIRKKRVILENRAPFPEHIRAFVKETELLDWLEMNLRLDGSSLTRENIKAVLDGEVMLGGRIMDHLLTETPRPAGASLRPCGNETDARWEYGAADRGNDLRQR